MSVVGARPCAGSGNISEMAASPNRLNLYGGELLIVPASAREVKIIREDTRRRQRQLKTGSC